MGRIRVWTHFDFDVASHQWEGIEVSRPVVLSKNYVISYDWQCRRIPFPYSDPRTLKKRGLSKENTLRNGRPRQAAGDAQMALGNTTTETRT